MLIHIINWKTLEGIFWSDKENNTLKDTIEEAVKQGISLRYADLYNANLYNADLRYADLKNADLRQANLSDADLTGASIEGIYLDGAILDNVIMPDLPIICPKVGSFIGYKKIWYSEEYGYKREFIVKLEIPEDAKRSSATTSKCRCSKAKVLEIKDLKSGRTINKITNINKKTCIYTVGEYVYPDSFDECRWNECSNGIHFFMTEEEAIAF